MNEAPRIAAVTGGSTGIGRAICEELLARGYEVVSLALERPAFSHAKLHGIEVDLADRQAAGEAAKELGRRFEVTTLVHNAGVIRPASVADVQLQDFSFLVELHLASAVQLLQATLPAMRARRFGRVVMMSSRAVVGVPGRTSYSATKAGLLGMARTWALELAGEGITVNVVAPGPIRTTAMFHGVIPAGSEQERQLAASVPVKRLGEPADVARAVAFFADPANSYVTGQVLYVCGGTSVGTLTL